MSLTYNISTNFGAKDTLPSGDPDKVIRGADFTTEFQSIQSVFDTAAPNASPTFTGTVTAPTFSGAFSGNLTGDIIGDVTGNVTGNVSGSANTWATPRTVTFTGGASGSVVLDGSSNESVAMTVSPTGHVHTTYDHSAHLSGATVFDQVDVTNGIVTNVATRTLTLADLGYTGDPDGNNYVHPSYSSTNINTSGATIVDVITTNSTGHVTALGTRNLTLANLGYTGATNANNYVHPSYNGDDFSIDTGALTGATVISDLDINVTTDSSGHVTDANATVATRTLTAANLGALKDTTDTFTGTLTVSGAITCTGDITAFSDERLKSKLLYAGGLESVEEMNGYTYVMNGENSAGVIAQELELIAPELVREQEGGYKAVNYMGLTAYLIEAVKELSEKVKELECK